MREAFGVSDFSIWIFVLGALRFWPKDMDFNERSWSSEPLCTDLGYSSFHLEAVLH